MSGLVRDVVFAFFFGAGTTADAFHAAFRVPNLLRELLAEGSLANIFVPIFAEETEKKDLQDAWILANAVLGVLLVVLGAVTLLFVALAEPFVFLVAAGFETVDGKVELATWLTRILAPFLAGLSIASLFGGMLNVRGRFFLPAIAPALLNLFVIAGCVLGEQWAQATGTPAIGAVAVAATLSGLCTAAIQYPALRREGFRFRPTLRPHPAIGRIVRFLGAALIGISVVQFNLLVETQIASRFGDGPVTYLILGFRLVQLPMGVVSASIAVASLAGLSLLLAREDRQGAQRTLSRALELNALFVVPSAVGLYLLADPLIALFYERGAFSAADTAATAGILRMYALAVVGICTYRVLLPVFFALKDPYLPMRLSLGVMAAKVPVALGLVYTLNMGIDGLPLSHAITVSAEVVALVWVLSRRLGWAPGFWQQQARIAVAATGMGGLVWALLPWASGWTTLLVCAVGGIAYLALSSLLGVREVATLVSKLRPPPPPEVKP
jgi:putative peptidoglycan lipid II flippase